jgi:hypothetical protein
VICLSLIFTAYYIFYAVGLYFGLGIIAVGIVIALSISWSLVRCADHFRADIYEDIALRAFGPRLASLTSVLMIMT